MRSLFALSITTLGVISAAMADAGRANPSPEATISSVSQVTLTTINCLNTKETNGPAIVARDATSANGQVRTIKSSASKVSASSSVTTFALAAGTYAMLVTQGSCYGIFDMTLLAALPRNVTVALNRNVFLDYHNHNSLAGVLPFAGLTVDLLLCVLPPCDSVAESRFDVLPVAMDGIAYYANQLPAGEWYLRLRFSNVCGSILAPIEGSDEKGMRYMHLTENFSAEKIETLWNGQRSLRRRC